MIGKNWRKEGEMKRIKTTPLRLFAFLLLTITFLAVNYGISMGAVWRVDGQNGSDPSECSGGDTWPTALKTIKKAVECVSSLDEIWVKEGAYVLTSTIEVNEAVDIYGGFSGNETQRDQRDHRTNIAVVTATVTVPCPYDSCFVLNADTTLDGLRFNGCGFCEGSPVEFGGAVKILSSSSTITNCSFSDNLAWNGGAVFNAPGSSLAISDCEFKNNRDYMYEGGGGAIEGNNFIITNSSFSDNSAGSGGAIWGSGVITNSTFNDNDSFDNGGAIGLNSGSITNCIFSANASGGGGGAISGGGVITNSIFNGNHAVGGGAIWINTDTSTITNCTFYDNYGPADGGNAILNGGYTTITNSIFWRDSVTTGDEIVNWYSGEATVTYNDIYGGYPGEGNIDADPLFVDPDNDDFYLSENSSCKDAGDNNAPELPDTDIDGEPRIINGVVDMGADEYDGCPNDPNKTAPGICGCGTPDADSDGDGTVDCVDTDDDNDGVADEEEQGPSGDDLNYDGNDDGIADSLQDNVASFHTYDNQSYVTMELPVGTSISNCKAVDNSSTTNSPSSIEFPYGFFEFTITGVGSGGVTTVILHFPVGTTFDTYYKYGPTPINDIDHWYEFLNDGQTGAEINGNVITLHFVDGKKGDDDLTVDGIVIDLGGPGVFNPGAGGGDGGGTSDGGGGGCFIGTAVNSLEW